MIFWQLSSILYTMLKYTGFPGGSDGKESACNSGDPGSIPGLVSILGREDPLEKGMVTHSSLLAWEIPWREEPGRLQSKGSQRVGHNRVTNTHTHTQTHTHHAVQ